MTRVLKDGGVLMRELREAIRLLFVYGALTWDKPFLGPLYAFLSHHPAGTYMEPAALRQDGAGLAARAAAAPEGPCSQAAAAPGKRSLQGRRPGRRDDCRGRRMEASPRRARPHPDRQVAVVLPAAG